MNDVFKEWTDKFGMVYLDDIRFYSDTWVTIRNKSNLSWIDCVNTSYTENYLSVNLGYTMSIISASY